MPVHKRKLVATVLAAVVQAGLISCGLFVNFNQVFNSLFIKDKKSTLKKNWLYQVFS
jgi:hypothetical protein